MANLFNNGQFWEYLNYYYFNQLMSQIKSDEYYTIKQKSEALHKAKGSRFLAFAFPVLSKADIKSELEKLKEIHPKANHHCYAWKLGLTENDYRANDDGEPSGTAGKPIYGQIRSKGVTNVLVVIVRYFGGTLLGVPGLIDAYKTSAALVLEEAEIIIQQVMLSYQLKFGYAIMNEVMTTIKKLPLNIGNKVFENDCVIDIAFRKSKKDANLSILNKIQGLNTLEINNS